MVNEINAYYAVIFTSDRNAEGNADYEQSASRMVELAKAQPGFLGVESVRSADGSGITVSYWDSEEHIRDWKSNAEHQLAQEAGRTRWYSSYHLRICKVVREYSFSGPSLAKSNQEWRRDHFLVTTDKSRLNRRAIHNFLSSEAYWSQGIPQSVVDTAIENSFCFGLFAAEEQIGFARVVTDFASFAWICDVYVERQFRGQGLALWLMECVISHPVLQNLRRICLATRDAHGLYEKVGLSLSQTPGFWMEKKNNEIYRKPSPALR